MLWRDVRRGRADRDWLFAWRLVRVKLTTSHQAVHIDWDGARKTEAPAKGRVRKREFKGGGASATGQEK